MEVEVRIARLAAAVLLQDPLTDVTRQARRVTVTLSLIGVLVFLSGASPGPLTLGWLRFDALDVKVVRIALLADVLRRAPTSFFVPWWMF